MTTRVCNITSGQLVIKRLIDILFGIAGLIITVLLTIVVAEDKCPLRKENNTWIVTNIFI